MSTKIVVPGPNSDNTSGKHTDEDMNILDDDTPLTEEEPDEESDEDEEPESEPDEELEEPETEEEEIEIPHDRPTPKDVKAKFPSFFKDFPELKEAFYREIEFTKIFPTVEDAREAIEDNQAFRALQDSAFAGNPEPILTAIQKADKDAYVRFARQFIPALYKLDKDLYSDAVNPLFERLIQHAYKEGERHNNDNLKNAALVISQLLFDDDSIAKGEKTITKKIDPPKDTREQDATNFRNAWAKINPQLVAGMKSLISKDLDPKKVFSPFLREKIVQEIHNRIDKQLEHDEQHMKVMNSRWNRAKDQGFSDAELSKIVSTYLARAKALIPSIREDVRKRALSTKRRASEEQEERVKTRTPARRESSGGRHSRTNDNKTKVNYREMSDLDILNS
jgi:hypothetical protein